MCEESPKYSRRTVAVLAAGASVGAIIPSPAISRGGSLEIGTGELLQHLREIQLKVHPSRLTLLEFQTEVQPSHIIMSAKVQLDWLPGMRRGKFTSSAETPKRALGKLMARIDNFVFSSHGVDRTT